MLCCVAHSKKVRERERGGTTSHHLWLPSILVPSLNQSCHQVLRRGKLPRKRRKRKLKLTPTLQQPTLKVLTFTVHYSTLCMQSFNPFQFFFFLIFGSFWADGYLLIVLFLHSGGNIQLANLFHSIKIRFYCVTVNDLMIDCVLGGNWRGGG